MSFSSPFFLLFASLSIVVGADENPVGEVLQLETAIDQALANNLGLITARYRPANAVDDVLIEEAAFDLELFSSTSSSESLSAAKNS